MEKLSTLLAFACLLGSIPVFAQNIPPVSEPVCAYCDARFTRGEPHKSWCPSYVAPTQQAAEQPAAAPRKSSDQQYNEFLSTPTGMIAHTVTSALGQTLAGWISGESTPNFSSLVEDRPELTNNNPGKSNGANNVVYDERSGRVGIWNNNSRRWLLKPWYYEDLIINDLNAIRAKKKVKKEEKWGIIDSENRTLVPFEFGSTLGFQGKDLPIVLFYEKDKEGPCRILVPDPDAKRGYRLMDETFEGARTYWEHIPCVTVKKDGKWGVISRNGSYLVEPAWEGVVPIGQIDEEEAYFTRIQTGWGMQAGEKVILPHEYKHLNINSKNTNIIATRQDGKVGVANAHGQFFLEPTFDKVERFTTQLVKDVSFFKVTENGKSGLFTEDGVLAAVPMYGEDADFELLALASQTQSYSQWLKKEIKARAAKKDEFETTADFEARKSDMTLMQKYIDKVMPEPEKEFVKWSLQETPRNKHTLKMSNYNADKGCFFITDSATPAFSAYPISIPIDKAAEFKEQMLKDGRLQEALKTAKYTVRHDRLYLSEIVFTLEDGTTYQIKTQ